MATQQSHNIELWCAQRVSNFEGAREIALGDDFQDMGNLDARMYRLEQGFLINTPPPMLKTTSDSLVYRLRRLDRQLPHRRTLTLPYYPVTASSAEELLKTILSRLVDTPIECTGEEEMSRLGALSQHLCHAAGRRNIRAPDTLETFAQLYAFAAELSLEYESPRRHVPPPFIVPGPTPRSRKPGKACCGCCSCFCHKNKPILSERGQRWKAPRWVKNLWCFKKKIDDCGSSGTLAISED